MTGSCTCPQTRRVATRRKNSTRGCCKDPVKEKERRGRISISKRGHPVSEDTREKLRHSRVGKKTPDETKKKQSIALKGRQFTEDHIKNLQRDAATRKGVPRHPETCQKIKISLLARHGKTIDDVKQQEREREINRSKRNKLDKNPRWMGGISFEPYCIKFNDEFRERVRAFFGYICVECGSKQTSHKLHVHHVNFRKDACCSDDATPVFVTLCRRCHGKVHVNRIFWEMWFTEMINRIYGGKCYIARGDQ